MCCLKGKVVLEKWKRREATSDNEEERCAGIIHNTWSEDTEDGRLLRQFVRPLNNALALVSQVVQEQCNVLQFMDTIGCQMS